MDFNKIIIKIHNMLSLLLKIFNINLCSHPNVETNKALSYCPDCGKLIHINWYIIRCRCCGKKRIGILRGNKIIPIAKYRTNCGTMEYDIEKIDSLNYFDMNFAVAKKEEEIITPHPEVTQSWVDENEILNGLKYISQHLN